MSFPPHCTEGAHHLFTGIAKLKHVHTAANRMSSDLLTCRSYYLGPCFVHVDTRLFIHAKDVHGQLLR